jgi:predicted negative regulator of RcsB-dependent stress response
METHTTEEQQIAALKNWWKENGSSIVTGIVLGLAVLFGAKAWFAYQERTAQNASNVYMVMMNALETGDTATVTERAGLLISEFSRTPYAAFAALALAKLKLGEGELEAAQAQLQWALDNSGSGAISDVARLRLARVLVARGDLDAAGQLLDQAVPGSAFDTLYTEVRGDIYQARGELVLANDAYQQALAAMAPDAPGRQLLQLKHDSFSGRAATTAAEGSAQ